jgi:hypothetical protein
MIYSISYSVVKTSVPDPWHFGVDPDLYLGIIGPDPDPGGPKTVDPVNPDPEHW